MSCTGERHTVSMPRDFTIAGSDSSAGAGIQADLKTFAAMGVYGLSALTAITAQNTLGVYAAENIAPALVEAQLNAVLDDIGTDVVKTGMLSNSLIIEVVADSIRTRGLRLIVDPVMVAKSGDPLLQPEAIAMLHSQLLPLAEVVPPNLPEAEVLTSRRIETLADMRSAASALFDMGARHVVVKGGHRGQARQAQGQAQDTTTTEEPIDIYFDGVHFVELRAERIQTMHTHGTGCTFSAAITALLARGMPVEEALSEAKRYITGAIRHAPGLGHGHGPVGHFWRWKEQCNAEQV